MTSGHGRCGGRRQLSGASLEDHVEYVVPAPVERCDDEGNQCQTAHHSRRSHTPNSARPKGRLIVFSLRGVSKAFGGLEPTNAFEHERQTRDVGQTGRYVINPLLRSLTAKHSLRADASVCDEELMGGIECEHGVPSSILRSVA